MNKSVSPKSFPWVRKSFIAKSNFTDFTHTSNLFWGYWCQQSTKIRGMQFMVNILTHHWLLMKDKHTFLAVWGCVKWCGRPDLARLFLKLNWIFGDVSKECSTEVRQVYFTGTIQCVVSHLISSLIEFVYRQAWRYFFFWELAESLLLISFLCSLRHRWVPGEQRRLRPILP